MRTNRCARCGSLQPWEMWPRCHCGGEFVPEEVYTPPPAVERLERIGRRAALSVVLATFGLIFGLWLGESSVGYAVVCFSAAHRLLPEPEGRSRQCVLCWLALALVLAAVVLGVFDPHSRRPFAETSGDASFTAYWLFAAGVTLFWLRHLAELRHWWRKAHALAEKARLEE